MIGDPPSQAATDRLIERFRGVAPGSDAVVELGLGRMLVSLTCLAEDEERAAALAAATAGEILGRQAARLEVEPVRHAA